MKIKSGIYGIKNTTTGKLYVGSSVNIKNRWTAHRNYLKNNKHHNGHLQRSYNKHGPEKFEFFVIEHIKDKDTLVQREQYYIDKYNFDSLYNDCPNAVSPLGRVLSEEHKNKISNSLKGRKKSEETKKRLSKSHSGKKSSKEHRKSLSESHLGHRHSKKTLSKITKNSSKFIMFNGEKLNRTDWATKIGVTPGTLKRRISCWGVERALTTPNLRVGVEKTPKKPKTPKSLTFNNKTQKIYDWSLETGIKTGTIYARLQRGWSVERTLTTPTGGYKRTGRYKK